MINSQVAAKIKSFRQWAYSTNPTFGTMVDQALLQGQGLGDSSDDDLTSALTSLTTGLNSIANAAQLSVADYYNAQTQINNITAAAKAGVTTQQYATTASTANLSTANVGGIPLWLLLGGAAIAIILAQPHTHRRR